jgi:hypothetical protein
MPESSNSLSKEHILAALSLLNDKLAGQGIIGELCLFGGAAMVLAFDARESTRDVDGIFVPKQKVAALAAEAGEELGLPEGWLNDGVKGFVSGNNDLTDEGLPQYSHLRLMRPTAIYLLAMKCLAARVGGYDLTSDADDVLTLCRHLKLKNADEILGIVSRFYPDSAIQPKTRYFVQELSIQLQQSN